MIHATTLAWSLLVGREVNTMWPTFCTSVETFCCSQKHLYPGGVKGLGQAVVKHQLTGEDSSGNTAELQQRGRGQWETAMAADCGSSLSVTAIRWLPLSREAMDPSGFGSVPMVVLPLISLFSRILTFVFWLWSTTEMKQYFGFPQNLVPPSLSTSFQPKPRRQELGVGCISWSTERSDFRSSPFLARVEAVRTADVDGAKRQWPRTRLWASWHSTCLQLPREKGTASLPERV